MVKFLNLQVSISKVASQAIADYMKGKDTAIKFLVGQVMRRTKGQANPQVVNDLLKVKLESMRG